MSVMSKAIRPKRFQLRKQSGVRFFVESRTGTRFDLRLDNCSLTGLGATCDDPKLNQTIAEELAASELVPAGKISWTDHEYALGRLVIRNIKKLESGEVYVALSTVDSKVPLDGPLSQFLEVTDSKEINPFEFELSPERFSLADFAENQAMNTDLFAKCKQYSIFFREWKDSPKFLYHSIREPSMGTRVHLKKSRKSGRQDYIIMGSNDYLGLASHPKVMEAAKAAINLYGFGATGSPLTTGISEEHEKLCDQLSRIFKKEQTILFNSGYAANIGAIQGITSGQDLVVSDMLAHASIQDGMQMSRATSRFFKHNNMAHLDKVLAENRSQYSGCIAITEGVFSMDGDVPPLRDFVDIAKKHKARTFVDEAHSFGVVGPKGLGACDQHRVTDRVDMVMGTFSKIAGGIGGFISTSKDVADWLFMFARAHMFSVSIPPSTAAAAYQAIQLFLDDASLVQNLHRNIHHFVKGLRELGYPVKENHESAVVPVVIGDEAKLGVMNQYLQEKGVFVVPIVYPAVSRKACRFRFTVTSGHQISDLDYVLNVFGQALEKADVQFEELDKTKLKNVDNAA